VDGPTVAWAGAKPPAAASTGLLATAQDRPVVVIDFGSLPFDRGAIERVGAHLAGASDAVLLGEHQSRPDFPPALRAGIVAQTGCRPWVTLTCRDRNRVVLEEELAGLREVGVDGVHCVTGDSRAPGIRDDVTQVFDLDGPRLVSLARSLGLTSSVAATPAAPPRALRPARLFEKERAGAQMCFVNHAGGPRAVAEFVAGARAAGVTMPFVACVPVFTDEASASTLARFPGVALDAQEVRRVLDQADPVRAGIATAAAQARAMLEVPGVAGVNLSGAATSEGEVRSAEVMAAVGRELLGR